MTDAVALKLSRVIFGAMSYPGRSKPEQLRVLEHAIDCGITSIDTAPLYDAGESERIVGQAIAGRRDAVQVLTKCGLRWDGDHGQPMFSMTVDGRQCVVRKDSRPLSIAQGIDESLRRLRIETIDLMQIHHLDVDTPLDASLEALTAAREAGKIRAIGVSNFPLPELHLAHSALGDSLFSTQEQFHLLDANRSYAIREFAAQARFGFLAYSPLAQGVLAGAYSANSSPTDWRSRSRFLRPRALARINAVLEEHARPLAAAQDTSLSAVCLAWALAQTGVTNVIAGASSERHCEQNAAAMSLTLPPAEAARLGEALAACGAASGTLAAHLARWVDRLRRRLQSSSTIF